MGPESTRGEDSTEAPISPDPANPYPKYTF